MQAQQIAPEETIAQQLSHARIQTGLDVEEIADNLHIRRHYLEAIEEGQFAQLPGTAYTRGYLKRYSDFLQLDTTQILTEFDRIGLPKSRKFFTFGAGLDRSKHADTRLVGATLVAFLVVMLSWGMMQNTPVRKTIVPYETFGVPRVEYAPPARCGRVGQAYPPCIWEDRALWYRPVKTALKPMVRAK